MVADTQEKFAKRAAKGMLWWLAGELAEQLSAFSEDHVFSIDASLTERPTARLAETIRSVSEVMTGTNAETTEFTGGYAEIHETSGQ